MTSFELAADCCHCATGAGQGSDLTIQGRNVEAGRALQLLADNQIKLLAAQNTASEKSTNNSSGTFYTNTQVKAGD